MTMTAAAKAVRDPDAHTASQAAVMHAMSTSSRRDELMLREHRAAPPTQIAAIVPQTFASNSVPVARPRPAYAVWLRKCMSPNN